MAAAATTIASDFLYLTEKGRREFCHFRTNDSLPVHWTLDCWSESVPVVSVTGSTFFVPALETGGGRGRVSVFRWFRGILFLGEIHTAHPGAGASLAALDGVHEDHYASDLRLGTRLKRTMDNKARSPFALFGETLLLPVDKNRRTECSWGSPETREFHWML